MHLPHVLLPFLNSSLFLCVSCDTFTWFVSDCTFKFLHFISSSVSEVFNYFFHLVQVPIFQNLSKVFVNFVNVKIYILRCWGPHISFGYWLQIEDFLSERFMKFVTGFLKMLFNSFVRFTLILHPTILLSPPTFTVFEESYIFHLFVRVYSLSSVILEGDFCCHFRNLLFIKFYSGSSCFKTWIIARSPHCGLPSDIFFLILLL